MSGDYPAGSIGSMFPEAAAIMEKLLAERNALAVEHGSIAAELERMTAREAANWRDLATVGDELHAARAERDALAAKLARVEALHFARGRNILGDPVCAECSPLQPMPCPTLRALADQEGEQRCDECAVSGGHELWCSIGPETLTMGVLRERLVKSIELDGVHESKRVGLFTADNEALRPLRFLGVKFVRGEFVFLLALADPEGEQRTARPKLNPLATRERGTVALDGTAGPDMGEQR